MTNKGKDKKRKEGVSQEPVPMQEDQAPKQAEEATGPSVIAAVSSASTSSPSEHVQKKAKTSIEGKKASVKDTTAVKSAEAATVTGDLTKAAATGDLKESEATTPSDIPKPKKKTVGKREKRNIGEFYEWQDESAMLQCFAPQFVEQSFADLTKELLEEAKENDVTLDDVLKLPANLMNQREANKLQALQARQEELRKNARRAIVRLISLAKINAVERKAKELKKEEAEKRRALREKK